MERQVESLEPCPPFSFGNDTIRHFEKLSVLEHSSNWRFPRSRRLGVLRGYRRVAHPAFRWNRKSLKLLKVRVKFPTLPKRDLLEEFELPSWRSVGSVPHCREDVSIG